MTVIPRRTKETAAAKIFPGTAKVFFESCLSICGRGWSDAKLRQALRLLRGPSARGSLRVLSDRFCSDDAAGHPAMWDTTERLTDPIGPAAPLRSISRRMIPHACALISQTGSGMLRHVGPVNLLGGLNVTETGDAMIRRDRIAATALRPLWNWVKGR